MSSKLSIDSCASYPIVPSHEMNSCSQSTPNYLDAWATSFVQYENDESFRRHDVLYVYDFMHRHAATNSVIL